MTPIAMAIGKHCEQRPPPDPTMGSFPQRTLVAVRGAAAALQLLAPANRDLALDDLLDHVAAWAVGRASRGLDVGPDGDGSQRPDGAAVEAFLGRCCGPT